MRDSLRRTVLVACSATAALGVAVAAARAAAWRARRQEMLPFGASPGGAWKPWGFDIASEWVDSTRDRLASERVERLSRRKQDFLGLLSHELRNPLSAINVALAVMRSRDSLESGQHARRVIERQVAHISRLVDDMVDTARIERGTLSLQMESIDLREVLGMAADMAEPSVAHRRQDFVWNPPGEPMLVSGDRVRLQQVFSNLLLNASKYTPEQGRIELLIYRAASDFCVAVRDSGRGIPSEDLAKVFEPFVRASRDEPGLGVGLYVARTLIEQHGGVIGAESHGSDPGTTFTVRLPELSPLLQRI
jgi:signal transduction histidine kinase